MDLRRTPVALLAAWVGIVGGFPGVAQAAPTTVNNYCAHPTYAPGGTSQPVVLAGPGFSISVTCGRGAGNVYEVRPVHPTWVVESGGNSVCWRPGSEVPLRTSLARVYTVSRC